MKDFIDGFKKSSMVGLAYVACSFTFGVFCFNNGIAPITAIITSLTNLSSAGQFAGAKLMIQSASLIEIGLTVLFINLRYLLMSLSLSQKLDPSIKTYKKMIFGFVITDEIYALAIKEKKELSASFMFGIGVLPILGWVLGTTIGVVATNFLPPSIQSALGIGLYAMLISIFVPDCKDNLPTFLVVISSIILSCLFFYLPFLSKLNEGFRIVLISTFTAGLGGLLFPVKEESDV